MTGRINNPCLNRIEGLLWPSLGQLINKTEVSLLLNKVITGSLGGTGMGFSTGTSNLSDFYCSACQFGLDHDFIQQPLKAFGPVTTLKHVVVGCNVLKPYHITLGRIIFERKKMAKYSKELFNIKLKLRLWL